MYNYIKVVFKDSRHSSICWQYCDYYIEDGIVTLFVEEEIRDTISCKTIVRKRGIPLSEILYIEREGFKEDEDA